VEQAIVSLIEQTLQKVILPRISDRLWRSFTHIHARDDRHVAATLLKLSTKDQGFFGISPKIQSPSNWELAVLQLNRVSSEGLPWRQIGCILDTFRAINTLFTTEHDCSASDMVLGGDDILPIFIFVLTHSSLTHMVSLSEFLWSLIDSTSASGEAGYYLTVFTSAVHYLKSYEENTTTAISQDKTIGI